MLQAAQPRPAERRQHAAQPDRPHPEFEPGVKPTAEFLRQVKKSTDGTRAQSECNPPAKGDA